MCSSLEIYCKKINSYLKIFISKWYLNSFKKHCAFSDKEAKGKDAQSRAKPAFVLFFRSNNKLDQGVASGLFAKQPWRKSSFLSKEFTFFTNETKIILILRSKTEEYEDCWESSIYLTVVFINLITLKLFRYLQTYYVANLKKPTAFNSTKGI